MKYLHALINYHAQGIRLWAEKHPYIVMALILALLFLVPDDVI